jgi:hypothetical protein
MAERVHHDLRPKDVVSQTVFAPAGAPLAFAGFETGESLDRMLATSVMRIFGEDAHQAFQCVHQDLVAFRGPAKIPLERRSRQDAESRGHTESYFLVLAATGRTSARNLAAGRALPR